MSIKKSDLSLFRSVVCAVALLGGLILTPAVFAQSAQVRVDALKQQADEANKADGTKADEKLWCEYVGESGPGKGKHIVLISGDDEYRSEESMPMLGKILAKHHGFKCSVLFAIDPETNTIKPNHQTNIPGMQLLDNADLVILGLRFRNLPDDQMKHFVDYLDSGKPIIGTRTSTHAFNYPKDSQSKFKHFSWRDGNWKGGFGQQVLGDTWISHHGGHKTQSCRGVIVEGRERHPILKGVTDVWGPSDVYGIRNLPKSANVLMRGAVLDGMNPDDEPVAGKKNDPMMPLAWVKRFESKSGKKSKIFCTTMGAATDFESEDLRRMIVNASFWCLNMKDAIPDSANVDYVGEYDPTEFGFDIFKTGMKPSDFDWNSN